MQVILYNIVVSQHLFKMLRYQIKNFLEIRRYTYYFFFFKSDIQGKKHIKSESILKKGRGIKYG